MMSACNDKVPLWRVVALFLACIAVYMYLYTNVFDGMRTSAIYSVVEGDLQAVWRDKIGSVSYYLKLMEQSNNGFKLPFSGSPTTEPPITKPSERVFPDPKNPLSSVLEKYGFSIITNSTLPLLTLFTSWNDSPSKYHIHNITINNWLSLRPFVIPVLFTNETTLAEHCSSRGWEVLPISAAAAGGIPVLKNMYIDVMDRYNTTFYAYANGDILFTERLIDTLISILGTSENFTNPALIVGQRTNVKNLTLQEGRSWKSIREIASARGKLFTGWAEDYFITPTSYPWHEMPEVVIGRRAYDNWLVYNGRKAEYNVIDATKTLLAVHQTDEAGNFEGHHHKDGDYNHNLLSKIYKRIKYNAGIIECIDRYTEIDKNKKFLVKSKTLPRSCAV